MRDIRVTVTVRDAAGNLTTQDVNVREQETAPSVLGGYYLSGNGDMQADTASMGIGAFTQYRSFADGSTFPGWQKDYLKTFLTNGIMGNFVTELKYYGAAVGVQNFTVEGRSYSVPAPTMTIQQRGSDPAAWSKAYGYGQVTSGTVDGVLHRAAYQLKSMLSTMPEAKVNVQIASEFDTDHEFGTTENGVAYTRDQSHPRAVAAVKYIVNYMRSKVTHPGVTYSVGMAGGAWAESMWVPMHPDDLAPYVDYIHYNVYRTTASQTAYDVFRLTKNWVDTRLSAAWRDKKILVAEWGTKQSLGDQSSWIRTVGDAISRINSESATGSKIIMANYFNSVGTLGTQLDPKADGLAALTEIYSKNPFG